MKTLLQAAKAAKAEVCTLSSQQKNAALLAMADSLIAHSNEILSANAQDVQNARGIVSDVMIDLF